MGMIQSKTLEESLQESKRQLNRGIREIGREIYKLELQQKEAEKSIRMYVKKNDLVMVKSLAREIVKIKHSIRKYSHVRFQMNSMKIKLQTVKSTEQITKSLTEMNVLMKRVNARMQAREMHAAVTRFQKESNELELKEEMMEDMFDSHICDPESLDEEDELVSKVLEEMGIHLNAKITALPDVAIAQQEKEADPMETIEQRINNLRKE